ncbi:MAG: class I adenylate-forming enzyme family protein [Planctomycetota bacterium]
MNLFQLLVSSADKHGERPAATDVAAGTTITYIQLHNEAVAIAQSLRSAGVSRGDRVGLLAPNGIPYLPAAFGILAADACMVPVPWNATAHEKRKILEEIDVNGYLVAPDSDHTLGGDKQATLETGCCAGFDYIHLSDAQPPVGFHDVNPAFVRFTSGTTGASKGVVLSHEATAARVEASDAVLEFTAEDRVVWVLPLAYHFAVTIVAYVRAGLHMLLCNESLPAALHEAIVQTEATVLYASPVQIERLANLKDDFGSLPLRLAVSTAAPITTAACDRFEARYAIPVTQAYGIIEAGLPCIQRPAAACERGHDVGPPVPGYEIALFADDRSKLPDGSSGPGEIGLRGPGLFSAYYSPWSARDEHCREGFFLTGDIGIRGADGALQLVGRRKAMLFVAGMKFFPEEVEQCLESHPAVRESRVVAVRHPRMGQIPHAEVALHETAGDLDLKELRQHCASLLSPYKVPVHIEAVAQIARTGSGKVLRWRDDELI